MGDKFVKKVVGASYYGTLILLEYLVSMIRIVYYSIERYLIWANQ